MNSHAIPSPRHSASPRLSRYLGGLAICLLLAVPMAGCDETSLDERVERAQEFLDQKRPQGAIIELKLALQKRPEDPELRLMLGKSYLALGRLKDAEKEFVRYRKYGGEATTALLYQSSVWSKQGRHSKILQEIQEDPEWSTQVRITLLQRKAGALIGLGKVSEARDIHEKILALEPGNTDSLIGMARIARLNDDEDELRRALDAALKVAPRDPYLLRLDASLAFGRSDYATAAEIHRERLAGSPKSVSAKLQLAEALLAQGQTEEPRALLRDIVTSHPRHQNAHYLLAVIALKTEDYAAARHHGMKSLAEVPRHLPSQFITGMASYALGNFREARWYLGLVLNEEPENERVAAILEDANARYLQELEEQQTATQVGERPLSEDLVTFGLSEQPIGDDLRSLLEDGEPQAIAMAKDQASRTADKTGPLLVALAYERAGRSVSSRTILEYHLKENPEDTNSRSILVDLYLLDESPREAEPHLTHLFENDPNNSSTLNNLAWVLMSMNRLEEARSLAERAMALAPEDPQIMDTLGVVMLKSGETEAAIPLLARAARNEAAGPEISLHLAQALRDHGEIAAARLVLQTLLASESANTAHGAADTLLRDLPEAGTD